MPSVSVAVTAVPEPVETFSTGSIGFATGMSSTKTVNSGVVTELPAASVTVQKPVVAPTAKLVLKVVVNSPVVSS